MAFREVPVHEIKEVLRIWLRGESLRRIERLSSVDRKTVRRYVAAAQQTGVLSDGGEDQLTDEVIAKVCEVVRPHRTDGHGEAWETLRAHHDEIKVSLEDGLTVRKVHELLSRKGIVVPERTLHRYALEVLGHGRSVRQTTVRVADGEPGSECQMDFGKMGLVFDPERGRRRVCFALIFTACYSRHCFVYLTFSQTTDAVISGCEAAWRFFHGIFKVLVPDNLTPIVTTPDALEPRINRAFYEYAQSRGFLIDPARVRRPQDKPRVERTVPFVRNSFFKGETFADLEDAQVHAEEWCHVRAGMRVHGTTQLRPAEVFVTEEQHKLLSEPTFPYLVPHYANPKVHRDRHIEVLRAIYSVPGELIGRRVDVVVDQNLVRISYKGALVRVHHRTHPGGRVTDPDDLPKEKTAYALRDLDRLVTMASLSGPSVGAYAKALVSHPLPWTKMRQVYALLGLAKKWGDGAVDDACRRALEAEAVNVALIGRMLARGEEAPLLARPVPFPGEPARFRAPGRALRDEARWRRGMSALNVEVTPELRALLRRVKLGQVLSTLPERLALAKAKGLSHAELLELVLSDEVTRRDATSAERRAKAAGLDSEMRLEHFDDTAAITYDHELFNELFSLRFVEAAYNVLILGPVGVGKTFLANALGHAAVRRRYGVHFERTDLLLKRLRAARLDNSHDQELKKLIRYDLLILDDLCLQQMDSLDTADVYELIVERHRKAATIVTSNREPPEWLSLMADGLLAQSAIDRLQSAAYELVLEGESYRRRERPVLSPETRAWRTKPASGGRGR